LLREVSQDLASLGVRNKGTDGYADDAVLPRSTSTVSTCAILAALGAEHRVKSEINQSIQVFGGNQKNTAAIPAIAPVRPTEWNVFFTPEPDAAIAAIASFNPDFSFVNEFHGRLDKKAPSETRLFEFRR
jgi:hypothetical protein